MFTSCGVPGWFYSSSLWLIIKFTGTESSPILLCSFYEWGSTQARNLVQDSTLCMIMQVLLWRMHRQLYKWSLVPRPSLQIAILFAPSPMENTGPRIFAWSLAGTDHFGHLSYFQSHECQPLVTLITVAPMETKWVNKAFLMPSGEIVCRANWSWADT